MYVFKRKAFAMILAIFIVVLISLGGLILLGNASVGSKTVGDKYVHAQAEMIALSAIEFAVMRAQGYDTNATGNCLRNVVITVNDANGQLAYNANVRISYSFQNAAPNAACIAAAIDQNTTNPTMMLMDTVVTAAPTANLSTEPVRVFKRTWQRL